MLMRKRLDEVQLGPRGGTWRAEEQHLNRGFNALVAAVALTYS